MDVGWWGWGGVGWIGLDWIRLDWTGLSRYWVVVTTGVMMKAYYGSGLS